MLAGMSTPATSGRRLLVSLLSAGALLAAGCGSDDSSSSAGRSTAKPATAAKQTTTYPVDVENCGNTLTIDKPPQRVVAGSGPLGEVLASIGVADRLVGLFVAPEQYGPLNPAGSGEDYLSELKTIKVLNPKADGEISAEAVLAARPDFVFSAGRASGEGGPSDKQYQRAGITVFQYSFYCGSSKDQSIEQDLQDIRNLGIIFNAHDRADAVITHVRGQLAAVQKAIAGRKKLKMLYWEAYTDKPITLTQCCLNFDIVDKAGGKALFPSRRMTSRSPRRGSPRRTPRPCWASAPTRRRLGASFPRCSA